MKLSVIGPNQTEVSTKTCTVFFSYNTPVAAMVNNQVWVTEKKWSRTTSRHIKEWVRGRRTLSAPQSYLDSLVPKS